MVRRKNSGGLNNNSMNVIKDNTNGGHKLAKSDKEITKGKAANSAGGSPEAGDDNNSLVGAIQEAIQLEDDEREYSSSAQAQEEDALLKEFGF